MNDSQHFLLEHFDAIHNSPSCVYHSALPFCPTSSWLHECYNTELLQGVKVIKGLSAEWGTCLRTVALEDIPLVLACWKDTIAVAVWQSDIAIIDAITGSLTATLSEHTSDVASITFSSDGTSLASGSSDMTIKLWDMQTGGVIKTLCGHLKQINSVSFSQDCTVIASGSDDCTIRLWDIETGECYRVIEQSEKVKCVGFSLDRLSLVSASGDGTIKQWDANGCQTGPTHKGSEVIFSPDGTLFVSLEGNIATVQNSDSGTIVAKCLTPDDNLYQSCFSPNSEFLAGASRNTIYVWNITSTNPHLVGSFSGHAGSITSLTFSSFLISSSSDMAIKFWQISASSTNPVATDSESTQLTSDRILSVSLQTNDGIVVSSDSAGVIRTWDIITGCCKESFHTSAKYSVWKDVRFINGRLILAWYVDQRIYISDTEKGEPSQTVDPQVKSLSSGLRISADGSKVFFLSDSFIQAWSIQTGDVVGEMRLGEKSQLDALCGGGSRVWVHSPTQGLDFGSSGSSPILLLDVVSDRPHLDFISTQSRVVDTVTGQEVFQLSGKYARPDFMQWDGRYLATGYESGEVLILDFIHMLPQ